MARQYAKLYLSVWAPDSDFRKLTGDAQRLYFLLLSSPRLSSAGCCVVQPRRWALQATDTTAADIETALAELEARRYVLVDHDTEEVLIRSFIRHDRGFRNPFLRKSVENSIGLIESVALKTQAALELAAAMESPASPQVEDSEEDRYEHSYEQCSEDASEDASEPNYIPQTSTISTSNHQSSTPVASVVLPEQPEPTLDDDMDSSIVNAIIKRCAARRTQEHRPANPVAYQVTVEADMQRTERDAIRALLAERPFLKTQPEKAATRYELARRDAQRAGA
jgi:hypothetical protein